MVSCREMTEMDVEVLDASMPWTRRLMIRFHKATCPYCRTYRKQLAATAKALAALPREEPSDDERARLRAAFRDRKR